MDPLEGLQHMRPQARPEVGGVCVCTTAACSSPPARLPIRLAAVLAARLCTALTPLSLFLI